MAASLGNGVVDYNTAATDAKKKLVANNLKINSDPNYVASEQQRALQVIAQRKDQGLDTTGQQKYLTNQLGYKAPAAAPAPTLSTNPSVNPAAAAAPKPDLKAQMLAIANKTPQQFSYDPNTDPAYQAALKRTQTNIGTGTSQAQAEMNRRGILNSTITSDRMGEINASEMSNLESTIVPQLMQAAYQKFADQRQQEQQQFGNLGTLDTMYTNEDQRAIENNFTEANMTGNYTPEAAKPIIQAILALKQQAESKTITAADRAKLSAQADGYRAQLLAMGVNDKAYGSNVNAKTASATPGIRTLQGQQIDAAKEAQKFGQEVTMAELTGKLPNGTKTTAEQQRLLTNLWAVAAQTGVIPDQLAETYGIPKGTQTQAAYQFAQSLANESRSLDISQQNANTSSASANNSNTNSNFNQLMDIWKATGKAPDGINGVTAGTAYSESAAKQAAPAVYEDFQSNIEKIADRDSKGTLKNPAVVEEYIKNNDKLSNYEKYRAWIASGLEWPEDVEIPTPGE